MSHPLKKLLFSYIFIAVFLIVGSADAAVFSFGESLTEHVQSGQVLLVPVYVAPEYYGEEISLAGMSVSFTKESLWMRSFTLAPEWLAVSDERATFLSNERGVFTTAAGYAWKASEPVYMGVLEFVATREGIAIIKLNDASYIFSKNNRNILTEGWLPENTFTIVPSNGTLPEQLFDIGIGVGSNQYEYGQTPLVRLGFESFGSVPTPVDITGRVVSENGVVVFEWKDAIVVETSFEYVKKVPATAPATALDSGYYSVLVTTHYNGDVTDNWRDTFTVLPHTEPYYVYGGALIAIIIGCVVIWVSTRRKSPQKVAF